MAFPGKIAIIGGGSWATALAKLLLQNCDSLSWYLRSDDRIAEFVRLGHNPSYLTDVAFDVSRINFSSDINSVCTEADTLLLATPSPYFKDTMNSITADISGKNAISAIKGIVPGENMLVTDYMVHKYGISPNRMLVIAGPCHAEEVALGHPAYLTVGCHDIERAEDLAKVLDGPNSRGITNNDVEGIEYGAVLKNVYAIASGIIHGLKFGDNFQAMMVSNAIREMERFTKAAAPRPRQICDSVYLGDLLVTAYSKFSRNHNFGSMIGRGLSVKAANMEMEQVAEGYYGTKCIHDINARYDVTMPILDGVYDILYRHVSPKRAMLRMGTTFV